jgi:ankyrin repeat protein
LHRAALMGHRAVTEWLLSKGAAVNMPDSKGETPLRLALAEGHVDVIKLLREHGGHE